MGHDGNSNGDKVFSRVMRSKQAGEPSSTKGQSTVVPERTGSPRAAYWWLPDPALGEPAGILCEGQRARPHCCPNTEAPAMFKS